MRILIVEDEALIAMDMELTLSQAGYEVLTATTGESALSVIASSDVDMTILDVHLHDSRSDDVAGALKMRGIPFVVCSGVVDGSERGAMFQDAYILTKPFSPKGLLDAVERLRASMADQHRNDATVREPKYRPGVHKPSP